MDSSERRQYPRVELDYVTVEIYSSTLKGSTPEVQEICPVINLSESGMRFHAKQDFSTGQQLRLTFLLPNSIVIIRTDAFIIYLTNQDRDGFDVGVQFKNIGIAEKKLIRHFIDKNIEKSE